MKQRTLAGRQVSAIGLGAMPLSMNNDKEYPSFEDAVATVHAALDAGVTLIDTGDFYAMGRNELLLAEALRGRDRDSYTLSVKFGMLRGPGNESGGPDNRPEAVKNFQMTEEMQRLRDEAIGSRVVAEKLRGAIRTMAEPRASGSTERTAQQKAASADTAHSFFPSTAAARATRAGGVRTGIILKKAGSRMIAWKRARSR